MDCTHFIDGLYFLAGWKSEEYAESSLSQLWHKASHRDTSSELHELQLLPSANVRQAGNGLTLTTLIASDPVWEL